MMVALRLYVAGLLLLLVGSTADEVYSMEEIEQGWLKLRQDADAVSPNDAGARKAAEYAVQRIDETYGKVLHSAHYSSAVQPSSFFTLSAINKAYIRRGTTNTNTGKYLLEILLTSSMASAVNLDERLRNNEGLQEVFREWRAERAQEVARTASQGKSVEEYRKALMNPQTRTPEEEHRFLRAFFLGIDPIKDAAQDDVPAYQPEVHRVVVQHDAEGELDVQFHQRVGFLTDLLKEEKQAEKQPAYATTLREEL